MQKTKRWCCTPPCLSDSFELIILDMGASPPPCHWWGEATMLLHLFHRESTYGHLQSAPCIQFRQLYFKYGTPHRLRRISSALIIGCSLSTHFICIRQGYWISSMVEALPKLNVPCRFGDPCQIVVHYVMLACGCREWMPLFKTNARMTKLIETSRNQMRSVDSQWKRCMY